MAEQVCRIAGCDAPAESQGMCAQHFTRALVYGQVRTAEGRMSQPGAAKPIMHQ